MSLGLQDAPNPSGLNSTNCPLSPSPTTRLYRQTIRLAFLVLSLAKIDTPPFNEIRDSAVRALKARQLRDGSWADYPQENDYNPPGRPETTAWAVLALHRLNAEDADAKKGANFLCTQLQGINQFSSIPRITAAATLKVMGRDPLAKELRKNAIVLACSIPVSQEEQIAFFDYPNDSNDTPTIARDYLCYPAFYPLAVLINALLSKANLIEQFRLSAARMKATEQLVKMLGNAPLYTAPGARFSATVDQAMLALTLEQLEDRPLRIDPIVAVIRPLGDWASDSWIIQFILPIAFVTSAVVTLQSPSMLPSLIQQYSGITMPSIIKYTTDHASTVQCAVAVLYALVPQVPKSVFSFVRRKFSL
jgi:hypothetical protein